MINETETVKCRHKGLKQRIKKRHNCFKSEKNFFVGGDLSIATNYLFFCFLFFGEATVAVFIMF